MIPAWIPDAITPDLDRGVHFTLLWGLEGIVLREVGRGQLVPDVNEPKLRHRLDESEVTPVAAEPGLFASPPEQRAAWMNDLERLREAAAFCRRFAIPTVIAGALPGGEGALAAEALRRAGEVVARAELTLSVRNEGAGRRDAEAFAELLETTDHPAVRAAWAPPSVFEPGGVEETRILPRLGVLIVRDARGSKRARPGEGDLGWGDRLAAAHRTGFEGPVVLDLAGVASKEALHEATALVRLIRSARRSA